ncbi:FAD:protein FMN transferase [Nocardioides marmoriginsengisoli]|uniref:FAD:protein FMN transferase n=1 Tax=Nocardioides marmoriginsengisoli TaxID=661483 RepID=A0A3N0CD23_9ACTN|nr:FAD:protein FMN transferase [Nocardioides marmoriginsengisoli]RNL61189.1 FAD:protein FMN transferase [Nocardioides marmoriginsengisoli]
MTAAEWDVWSTTARLVVTDSAVLDEARGLCADVLSGIGRVASRFDPASELSALADDGRRQAVSPLLSDLIAEALGAAAASGGAVDPTIGGTLSDLGYDRDIALVRTGDRILARVRPVPGWQRVSLVGDVLTMPAGVLLDLGATAKASAADRCARAVAARFRVGALVAIGGDIATAGDSAGWQVEVRDLAEDVPAQVVVPAGWAISTSSTRRRTWTADGRLQHHLIDPRTSRPVVGTWAAVTAVARTCLAANTATTAAMVHGLRGQGWLDRTGLSARALTTDGRVVRFGGWDATERAA